VWPFSHPKRSLFQEQTLRNPFEKTEAKNRTKERKGKQETTTRSKHHTEKIKKKVKYHGSVSLQEQQQTAKRGKFNRFLAFAIPVCV
jgi:hypothetical protein